jgi:RND family efflux transporter MFP subunit
MCICFLVLAILVLGGAGCSTQAGKSQSQQQPAPQAPEVVVANVIQKTVPIYTEYVGQAQSVDTVEIRSQVTGFLKEFSFIEGSVVEVGKPLFFIDPRPFEAALSEKRASLDQNLAALNKAQGDVDRYRPLVDRHAISKEQLATALAALDEAKANVEAARAQVATAELNLGYTSIAAPIHGQIGQSQVKTGALVQAGNTLLTTIYSIDPIYVMFNISQNTYLQYAERFMQAPGNVPLRIMLAGDTPYPHTGKIDMITPDVNTNTGTLGIRAVFPNPKALLKSGLFVRVRMILTRARNALLVPKPAVQELQGTQSVDVVGPDNKVQFRTVTVEGPSGNAVIISSGLKAGERVIVEGQQKVRPGMVVKPVPFKGPSSSSSNSGSPAGYR